MTQDLVDRLSAQVEQRIHGPEREKILKRLEQDPSADALAEFVYNTILSIDQQADNRGAPVDIDVLMGVATETIDRLVEILEAMAVEFDPDEMREETLLKIVMLHMKAVEGNPEEKAAAEELLLALTEDGTMQNSMDHVSGKASASDEQMAAAGQSMLAPKQKPLSAGVQKGLMQP
jgi:hypothetical protein